MILTFTPGSEWLMAIALFIFWLHDRRHTTPRLY